MFQIGRSIIGRSDFHAFLPSRQVEVITNYRLMRSHENEVEDAGNIGLTTFEETGTESKNSSIVNEESDEHRLQAQKKNGCHFIPGKSKIWKIFKSIVFLICLILVVIQTIEFYQIYSKYPTNIVKTSIAFEEVKFPAVTMCFKNTISTKEFCHISPDRCEKPSNLEEFCENHPIHCKGDTSNLKIPMTRYFTNDSRKLLQEMTEKYLSDDKFNNPYVNQIYGSHYGTRTFVYYRDLIYKCYSRNLHLYQSGARPNTMEIAFNTDRYFGLHQLELYRIELFGRPGDPQVFLGVHSPFVPINPVLDGHPIRSGYTYVFYVQLDREEHLLPFPYQTNCRDNGPSKDVKNFTNPNSFQMCLEICQSERNKIAFGCGRGMEMASSPNYFCRGGPAYKNVRSEIKQAENLENCMKNCRPGCLKLHYGYRVEEIKYPAHEDEGIADIQLIFRNRKVNVQTHFPLYGSGALFSHIGGLLAYWLGISVFTSLDFVEKVFGVAAICWTRFRKNKVQDAPPYANLN